MVDLIDLINAMSDTLGRIPDLVADLADGLPDSVVAYIDIQAKHNSVGLAIYQMKPGTVMVAWDRSAIVQGEMTAWVHQLNIYVRALRGQSPLTLIRKIINGVPVPGDGMRWRYCPLLAGCLPTDIDPEFSRLTDEEGIDYYVIYTLTKELGDT